jgi:phosphate transport system substrate-binding protein
MKKIISVILLTLISIIAVIGIIIGSIVFVLYLKDKEYQKYSGHGFAYMHGYSSTDFTGYHVYDGDKLVRLDHEPAFVIENEEDMPILDGAEACYPIYTAVAKTLYKDIDKIEEKVYEQVENKTGDWSEEDVVYYKNNGKIVTFTNSKVGYYRLIDGEADLFFGARPSKEQLDYAQSEKKEIESIVIGKEAFVFFVEEDNPIEDISSDDLRKIYSGQIRNWKELGGKNQKIIAFQRPEDSGSQVMMHYFMKDVPLKEAETVEMIDAMSGVVKKVKQYHNEQGALGYTFRYFLEGLQQEKGVRMLSVDGVYPSVENIKNNTYPIIADLVVSKLKDNEKNNVNKMIEFLLSQDGQYIIEKTGYGGLGESAAE